MSEGGGHPVLFSFVELKQVSFFCMVRKRINVYRRVIVKGLRK